MAALTAPEGGGIKALGYVGVHAPALDGWTSLGADLFGLEPARLSRETVAFRMDAAARRLIVSTAQNPPLYIGWEMENAVALAVLSRRLDACGYAAWPLSQSEMELRGISAGIATIDPCGHRLEFFTGQVLADTPFAPGRAIAGFRTGQLGMGHAVLNVVRIDDMLPFYTGVLGFRLSDYTNSPFKAYFFHINARHHSLALIESSRTGLHHLLLEVAEFDDLGHGYDLALLEAGRVATTLGRHANDHMVSFYARTPSDFFVEYGWGGLDINPGEWRPAEVTAGPSLWGHDRDWLLPEARTEAQQLRLKAAAQGLRAPLPQRITR